MDQKTEAWPNGISAITLFVEDLPAARQFYLDIFGLALFYEDAVSAVFRFGGTLVNLLQVSQAPELIQPAQVAAPQAGHRSVFTITVDDVDGLAAQLIARGVQLINGPLDRPWGIRTASFADPSGQIWEIAK
jgi:catechol 2,3-dioxygenase-like lactoylglutathione lyase family enzyme